MTTIGTWRLRQDLMECFELIDNTLDDESTKEMSKADLIWGFAWLAA